MLKESGDANAERISTMSRIFSNDVAGCIAQNAPKILWGSGVFDQQEIDDAMDRIAYNELIGSNQGLIENMDRVADFIFER